MVLLIAYQLLGSLLFEEDDRKVTKKILSIYDETLEANVYRKIYDNLSENEKSFLFAMTESTKTKIANIISTTGMKNNMLQVYKIKLEKSGIITSNEHGYVSFALPRFMEFIRFQKALMEE